ncbi:MAG: LuxR family transcriptional regulator, partial [Advenella sp.]
LILTDQYIGFLPDHYAATWVEKGQMTAIAPDRMHFTVPIAIAMRKGRRQNLIVERFLAALDCAA